MAVGRYVGMEKLVGSQGAVVVVEDACWNNGD